MWARAGVIFVGLVMWLLGSGGLPVGSGQPRRSSSTAPAATVDEQTVQAYEQFCQRILRRSQRMAGRMQKRYELDDRQQRLLREMLRRSAERFLRRHGRDAFALMARGRALGELMRRERIGWEEVPEELLQILSS